MFSPVSRGGQNFSHNHQHLCTSWMAQFADGVVTFWAGLPAHPVLVYFANLDGLTLNTWRWDDSSPFWDSPFPWPRVLDAHSPPLSSMWRLIRQGRGPTMHLPIHPQSPVVSPSLNLALHHRLQASIHSLSTTRPMVPRSLLMLDLISSCMAEEFLQSMRGSGALPVGVLQDILGLPESCRFCDASVGDLWHSLSERPEFCRSPFPMVQKMPNLTAICTDMEPTFLDL